MPSQSDYVTTAEANAALKTIRRHHQDQVREFRIACGDTVSDVPKLPNQATLRLGHKLVKEEVQELIDAVIDADAHEVLDALGDILYLTYGLAAAAGYDVDEAFDRIHAANMAKVGADGKVRRREDGKILKPDGWTPPDLTDLVTEK
ncbi:pyrophosphohydrolase domain-containing protein [Leucobacter musarum]|uniref:MazG-like family protein n=1 Tax=Leucobacter musarum TaxID=1930747 RepID=UPI0006A7E7F9|nr:MazG-like family protein [Leucobacter musarum]